MTINSINENRTYNLDRSTALKLHEAKNARDADVIFEAEADYIPRRHRADAWLSVDQYFPTT